MGNEKGKNVVIILLVAVVAILGTVLVLISTGHLNLDNDSSHLNNHSNTENNNQNNDNLLTEAEALRLGQDLYEYANNVGWCREFEYLHNQPGGSIVLNYEEVTSKFTQNYLDLSKNIFSAIKKGEDGKYYDLSVCGFGVSCANNSLTELKIINVLDNYITFDATVTTTSTGCGGTEVGAIVRTDTETFALKKENSMWKIDEYTFQYVTD